MYKKSKEFEVIVFSDDWFGLPFSCKHLIKHFLPEIQVYWVETIGLRAPKLNLYDLNRAFNKFIGWFNKNADGHSKLPEHLSIIDPIQIPYNQFSIVRGINKHLAIKQIKRKLNLQSPTKRILITTWPFIGYLVGCLKESLSIYYRVDDFSEFPGVNKESIIKLENDLIKKVDIVVATAENLTKLEIKGKNVKYLPHGVDYSHFNK
ncbi:glycosyltransferase family 1 protein, partial [Desulfobacteraceae bacterium SEEP-SAG9]